MAAQAEASPASEGPGGLPSPPGLEATPAALERAEALREEVLRGVDERVAQRAEELWARGKQMLGDIQQRHKETTARLADEVTRCREKQHSLEAENEKLKDAIQGLAARFSLLEQVASGREGPAELPGVTEDVPYASGSPPPAPVPSAELVQLPELPRFPFPAPASPAAPLNLAEAVGAQTPQRTPLSLANSLTSTPPEVTLSAAAPGPGGGGLFSFTLRKADRADLGLNVSHREHDKVLRVESVRPEGAVEAWNRQCVGGAAAEKAVVAGDKIISVNSIAYDPKRMLEECREKQLLKLTVVRGNRQLPTIPPKASPPKPSALRADASVFVPQGAENPSEQAEPLPTDEKRGDPQSCPDTQRTAERV